MVREGERSLTDQPSEELTPVRPWENFPTFMRGNIQAILSGDVLTLFEGSKKVKEGHLIIFIPRS